MSTNKQALRESAQEESIQTYYIHPAAFGGKQNPGHRHVPVVKAENFEKLRAKLEAAEKRIAELEARTVVIPDDLDFDCEFENGEYGIADEPWLRGRVDGFNTGMKEITKAIRAAGITVKGE